MTGDSADSRALAGHPAAVVIALAVVVGTAAGGLALARAQVGTPSGDQIVADARDRYEAAETVAGTATVTATDGEETRTFEVSFAVTDDEESRVSVTGPRGTVVAGSNGSVGWVHSERTGVTHVYSADEWREKAAEWEAAGSDERADHLDAALEAALPADSSWDADDLRALAWDWTRENTTAERVGTETLAGTEAYVVEVEPDDGSRDGTVRLWVAKESSTVLKLQFDDGRATVTVRFTETRFDVSVADSTFRPPAAESPDVATTADSYDELAAATSLDLPRLRVEGYEFAGGSTLVYGDATTVVQRYAGPADVAVVTTTADRVPGVGGDGSAAGDDSATDAGDSTAGAGDSTAGADSAETTTVNGATVTVVETDRGVAVTWSEDGLRHAVVVRGADQPRETALELAASVVGGGDS